MYVSFLSNWICGPQIELCACKSNGWASELDTCLPDSRCWETCTLSSHYLQCFKCICTTLQFLGVFLFWFGKVGTPSLQTGCVLIAWWGRVDGSAALPRGKLPVSGCSTHGLRWWMLTRCCCQGRCFSCWVYSRDTGEIRRSPHKSAVG